MTGAPADARLTTMKNTDKTTLSFSARALRRPGETRTVGECLGAARGALRAGGYYAASRLTAYEDWLELNYPRIDRTEVRDVRRRCEALDG